MKKILLFLAAITLSHAQDIYTTGTPANGVNVTTADLIQFRDVSVTSGAGKVRPMAIGELVNVPGFFSSVPNGTFALAKISQSGATTGQVPKWNGSAWAPAADDGGNVTSAAVISALGYTPANSATLGTASTATLSNDATFASPSASEVPSMLAVKAYVDANAGDIVKSIPVTNRNTWSRVDNTITGVAQSTSRKTYVCVVSADNVQLGFTNSSVEFNGLSGVTVKAAIEDDTGTIFPVTFSGNRTSSAIPVDGSILISDAVNGLTMVAGRNYMSRVMVNIPGSATMKLNDVADNSTNATDGRIDGVDRVDSGTITAALTYIYAPSLIIGKPTGDRKKIPVIGLIGDSIMDLANVGGVEGFESNWSVNALGPQRGRNFSHIRLTRGGGTVAAALTSKRQYFYPYLTHVVTNFGLNDVRGVNSVATIQANFQTFWRQLKAAGVERIWQCTITPDTSGSADESTRVAVNNWLRTVPNPLFGIIECADAMETSRNSGVWKSGYAAGDLYHPINPGALDLVPLMPLGLFD